MTRLSKRTWAAVAMWLALSGCALSCQRERARDSESERGEAATKSEEPTRAPSEDVQPAPEPPSAELGRLEAEGYVYGIVSDELGNALTATRRGRKAVYLIARDADVGGAAASFELDAHATSIGVAGRGAFAVGVGERVILLGVRESPQGAVLEEVFDVEVGGQPADFAAAGGLLWVAVRRTLGGRGIMALDPSTGAIVHRLESGPMPVALAAGNGAAVWAITLRDDGGGQLVRVDLGGDQPSRVKTDLPAVPLQLVVPRHPETKDVWVLLHGTRGVLPVDARSLVPHPLVALDFVPQAVFEGNAAATFFAIGGAGHLARVQGTDSPVLVERSVSMRTAEGMLTPDGASLLVVDAGPRRVLALEPATLDEQAVFEAHAALGRMALQPSTGRVLVTMPTRGEVLVLDLATLLNATPTQ